MNKIIEDLKEAVNKANEILQKTRPELILRYKKFKEIVTNCDIASENVIMGILKQKYPQAKFFSEEVGEILGGDELVFIIDPIDGTHNLIHNLPFYAISIGVYSKGKPFAGIIFLPEFKEYFYAVKGEGAFLNEKKINCAETSMLKEAIVSYDNQFHNHKSMLKNLPVLTEKCFTVRIFGSACVDLCNIARGHIDARIFHKTKAVDFAAGAIIIEEAGGKVSDFKTNPVTLKTHDVIASNGKIHQELIELLKL